MKQLLTAGLVLMAATAPAQKADTGAFKSVYSNHDAPLTTNPRSILWRGAIPVYAELGTQGRPVAGYTTEVRSRWTDRNLYVLFVCPYEELSLKPAPRTAKETNELWNWDVAEIFLGSDFQNIRRYKEFEVSPQGEWIDLDVDLALPHHEVGWTWNSGFQVTARIDRKAKIWYGAMRIPFAALSTQRPAAGTTFRANLLRSQGPAERHQLIAWKAPMTDTFHTPERFGTLELIKKR
jgi:hypothetical protein